MGVEENGVDVIPLPTGIRSRFVDGINGLRMHVLEAGFESKGRPLLLLLHGFPEIAYSWRRVMLPLAEAGYYVVAPDQRGYGWTEGWDGRFESDLSSFTMLSIVRDALALVDSLGYSSVASVIGHDFGSPVAAYCALSRNDLFRSVVMMSAPFGGPPPFKYEKPIRDIHADLAALERPRKHYQWYYSTAAANDDMWLCDQGVHAFLRAYFHYKSADWTENKPFRLREWSASELAKMPTYYIMDRDATMGETVRSFMPSAAKIAACEWLRDDELAVYATAYERTGFQGGLQWYRCMTNPITASELSLFAGRKIDIPSCFIAGSCDWGVYQRPGDAERMQQEICTRMSGFHLLEGAGHWVQQEQPEAVIEHLLAFLASSNNDRNGVD